MRLQSISLHAIILLFALVFTFFVSPVVISEWGRGIGGDSPPPLHSSPLALAPLPPEGGESEGKVKLTDLVFSGDELARSIVPLPVLHSGGLSPAGRSLLDADSVPDKLLLVHDDGKIELKDTESKSTLWEISTDSPLPSLEHVFYPSDLDYFLYPGKGSDLYEVTKGIGIRKHPLTIEEYVSRTPEIKGSKVTIGSKSSTLYTVDADTGEIIYNYSLPSNLSGFKVSMEQDNSLPPKLTSTGTSDDTGTGTGTNNYITIIRTDYTISSTDLGKSLWNWTKSFFTAYYPNPNFNNMLEPSSGIRHTIPIQIESTDSNKKRLLLASSFDENAPKSVSRDLLPLESSKSEGYISKNAIEGVVAGPDLTNHGNENSLAMPEDSFKSTEYSELKVNLSGITTSKELIYRYLLWFLLSSFIIASSFSYIKFKQNPVKTETKPVTDSSPRVSKKRKPRNKNGVTLAHDRDSNSESEKLQTNDNNNQINETLRTYIQNYEPSNGRWVGKLFVSNIEIGRGSNGTVVLEGFYDGRPVAVKRLLHAHHDVALKEIKNLIASDQNPNIVRLYGVEQDLDFVYISLERCTCSLADLIQCFSDSAGSNNGNMKGLERENLVLWRADGFPSPQLLKLMMDVVSGLAHLHELGIIHRDLKPQNVLINTEGYIKAKLSDMGISKRLQEDMSSLTRQVTGCGSSGWQAPEQLLHNRQSRSVDMFSLGCILFYCISRGNHPFGDYFERDVNIINNRFDLFVIDYLPEAVHLISQLLNPDPQLRPKAIEVLNHPFFWGPELRLSFLRDTSDRIDKSNEPDLLNALESVAPVAFGGKWNEKLDSALLADLGRYRKYNFDSVRDLLRVIRNKSGHYRELPIEVQESLGSLPDGFDRYFSTRFPKLLIEVYKVICLYCKNEDSFSKYFRSNLV